MQLAQAGSQRTHPSIPPDQLPEIWPLKAYKYVTEEDMTLFGMHMDACDKGDVAHVRAELLRCRRKVAYALMTHCFTKDEHDAIHPVKRFPRKKYIPYLVDEAETHRLLAVPKSRQIMVTWTFVTYFLLKAMFHRHRLIFFQSKKDDDAAALIDRAKHVYENLPWWMQEAIPLKRPMHKLPYNKIMFGNGSKIWGIPQGEDVVRQHTSSGMLADEDAFQNKAEDAYIAMKPTIDGGGQLVIVSSANGKNFFYRLVFDRLDEAERPF